MTRKEQNKILDDKIESNNNQYKIDRLNAEISAFSSGDLNKYEFLTRKDLNYKPNALDKARFEFSPLGRAFNEGLDKTVANYQEESVIKLLKEIRDNITGGINIAAGLIIPPGAPGAPGPPGPRSPKLRPRVPLGSQGPGKLDDSNKELNDTNKKSNDIVNRKSKGLTDKKLNDTVNNIKPIKLDDSIGKEDSVDKNTDSLRKNTRDLLDKINKNNKIDETDYDELSELARANLAIGNLKELRPLKNVEWNINRPPNIPTKKSKIKEIEKTPSSIRGNSKKLEPNTNYAGKEFAKRAKELEI